MRAKRSWLTIGVGCCAERDDGRVDQSAEDHSICYEQPRSVPLSPTNPLAPRPSASKKITKESSSVRENARSTSRVSLAALTRPRRSHSRPLISPPSGFRHVNGFDGFDLTGEDDGSTAQPVWRRRSFRPLQLSIYQPDGVGRLSPLPDFDFNFGDSWVNLPLVEKPAQALVRGDDALRHSRSPSGASFTIQRKPVGSGPGSRRSSLQSTASHRLSATTVTLTPTTVHGPGLRRAHTSGPSSPSPLSPELRARANTAPSARQSRAKLDVDDQIRELNTIVEERRASTHLLSSSAPTSKPGSAGTQPPPSPSHHVPHYAPRMRMHVRGETLQDIGSAFSLPLSSAPTVTRRDVETPTPASSKPMGAGGPLNSNPLTPRPTTPLTRLGAWLKRSNTSTSTPLSIPTHSDHYPFCTSPTTLGPISSPLSPVSSSSRDTESRHHERQTSADSCDSAKSAVTARSYASSPLSRTSSVSTAPSLSATRSQPTLTLTGNGAKRRPKPLDLQLGKEARVAAVRSAPYSPNAHILPGREMLGRDVGGESGFSTPVGVAF